MVKWEIGKREKNLMGNSNRKSKYFVSKIILISSHSGQKDLNFIWAQKISKSNYNTRTIYELLLIFESFKFLRRKYNIIYIFIYLNYSNYNWYNNDNEDNDTNNDYNDDNNDYNNDNDDDLYKL